MTSEKKANGKTVTELFEEGKSLYEAGKYEEAIEYFDKVLEIDPKYVNAWLFKGFALGNLGKHDEAVKCFNKALHILTYMINIRVINRKGEEIIKYYDKALETYDLYLKNMGTLSIEGSILDNIKKSMDKLAWYIYYYKGLALNNLGKYDEAIKCFNRALEIDPENPDVWYNKGLALNNLGKYDEAMKCFNKVLEVDPEYSEAWRDKGLALNNLGKYDEAIKCFNRALEIDQHIKMENDIYKISYNQRYLISMIEEIKTDLEEVRDELQTLIKEIKKISKD